MQVFECVLFDSEFTAWEGSKERNWSLPWEHRELIQLAAVKLRIDHSSATIVATFNELILPMFNPNLSDYIIELTGIQQNVVDEMGVDYVSAITLFHDFCARGNLKALSWGNDKGILEENCVLHAMQMPTFHHGFLNLQSVAKQNKYSGCEQSSGNLAMFHGLDLPGHQHNALFDVRSTVLSINHWLATKQLTLAHLMG